MKLSPLFMLGCLALGFTLATCGGGDGDEENAKALCMQACNKTKECNPQFASAINCEQTCATTGTATETCSNTSQIISALNNCLGKSCDEFTQCLAGVPQCQSTGGGGGSSGTAGKTGSGGTGGSSGGASCAACAKADTCCKALAMGQSIPCSYEAACNSTTGAQREQAATGCATYTQAASSINAACK